MDRLRPELIAEMACAASERSEFERDVLGLLARRIGADVSFFCNGRGPSDVSLGFDPEVRDSAIERWPEMAAEVKRLTLAAARSGGAVVDSECFGSGLERLVYYDTIMRPHRGHATLFGFLGFRGRHSWTLVLGRNARSPSFRRGEAAVLAELLPTLSLALRSHASAERRRDPLPGADSLSAREREVWSYLRLGYTNEQIALALGSAPRTVRNQLSRVYEKLGVSGRAEAVDAWNGTIVPSTERNR